MNKLVIGIVVAVLVVAGVGSTVYFLNLDDEVATDSSQTHSNTSTAETTSRSTSQESESTSSTSSVEIANFAFSPANITVKQGTTVTWTNNDSTVHTATSTDGPAGFDSGNLSRGESFSFTFEAAGTYNYICTPHPSMTGTITVTE